MGLLWSNGTVLFLSPKTWASLMLVVALLSNIDGHYSYNLATLVVVVWSLHVHHSPQSAHDATASRADIILLGLCLVLFSILLDIIELGIFAEDRIKNRGDQQQTKAKYRDTARFCLGMTILNLLCKPVLAYALFHEHAARGGTFSLRPNAKPSYGTLPSEPPAEPSQEESIDP
eukprot:m.140373 g.140373  ORF g.140373 m.140373 type:complete len:174 (-) comp17082_c0_seq4:127-648(-)